MGQQQGLLKECTALSGDPNVNTGFKSTRANVAGTKVAASRNSTKMPTAQLRQKYCIAGKRIVEPTSMDIIDVTDVTVMAGPT